MNRCHLEPEFCLSKIWHHTKPSIKEADILFSFSPITEVLDKINKPQICVEPSPLKSFLKTTNIIQEPDMCSLVSSKCKTFSSPKISHKTLTELHKHLHFRLISDDHIHVKRPSSFPEFDFGSTYMPRFKHSANLLYQSTVSISTEPEPISDDQCPWSDELSNELLNEVAALTDKE